MAATARVIWLCACVRYWPYRGVGRCASLLSIGIVLNKRHGTVDSIFILKTPIDKFVKSKPQKRRNLLFSCFVDSRKAFDRITRQKLFEKLGKEGIKGHFLLEIVMSMYSKNKSAVKINYKMAEAFPCYTGVKQGCMLSPTLFNLFLSDLPEFLNSSSSTDILLDDSERPINCFNYYMRMT